jgi:2-methylcitrate dehydratase PrpD
MGFTRALVDSVRSLQYDDVPEEAREVGRQCLLDFLGCALAGAREEPTEILIAAVAGPEASSAAALIGRAERASRLTAALVNGTAAHALDYDDTHAAMNGHPTAPVLPALLALADDEVDGRRFLTALVAGIELECRLGARLGGRHYAIGFHATGTLGTFGAVAACAHLLGLDEDAWLRAIGIAGSEAAGIKAAFGTMTKPLHAGRAASAGALAALLAAGGFTAPPDVLETAQGFAETHAGAVPERLEDVAARFLIRETLFKYHAACYLTHAAIEAAGRLRVEHALDPRAIESVIVTVAPSLLGVCNIQAPTTGLEGKFSLRATTALALLGEDTGAIATYADAKIRDEAVVRLRDRVSVEVERERSPMRARVVVTAAGRRLEDEVDTGVPAADLAAQRCRLRKKFDGLAGAALGAERAGELAETALAVDRLSSIRDLVRRLGA